MKVSLRLINERPASDVVAFFEDGYVGLGIEPHDFGGGFGTGGDASDDDDFLGHN
jgi:hypothetical protein